MASYEEILKLLNEETEPINASGIAKMLKLQVKQINTSLSRLAEKGWLYKNEEKRYTITDEGRNQLKPVDYRQFVIIGQRHGIAPDIVALTAEHVWRGGDSKDLNWVWKAMQEMGIRFDLARRWLHSWRSYLHQDIPFELIMEPGFLRTSINILKGRTTMPKLELEVTEELMRKIEVAAKECLVTPEHFATCKLSMLFREKESPAWLLMLAPFFRNIASAMEGILAEKTEKKEERGL
jgi:predicted transcriptional regulator